MAHKPSSCATQLTPTSVHYHTMEQILPFHAFIPSSSSAHHDGLYIKFHLTQHTSPLRPHHHPRACHILTASNNDLLTFLCYYHSPLIIAIDGSYHPPIEHIVFPSPQPHSAIAGHAVASVVFLAIDNITQGNAWLNKPTIPLLACIQPLPAAYGTSPASNNSAELLTRILALKLLPPHILAIIIYDSQVIQHLHHGVTSTPYTIRHLARILYPSIFRSLAHRLHHITNTHTTHYIFTVQPHTYLDYITTEVLTLIRNLPCAIPGWHPRHLTSIHQHTYIKIKSHQL